MDDKMACEEFSDDSNITVRTDESVDSGRHSAVLEEDGTVPTRKQKEEEIEKMQEEIGVAEKIAPVNFVKRHDVETASLEDEVVCEERVMSDEKVTATKAEREKSL